MGSHFRRTTVIAQVAPAVPPPSGDLFFSDGFETGNFAAWNLQGSLSVGTSNPMYGVYSARVARTNGDSGIDGCVKFFGTAGDANSFEYDGYFQFASRFDTFTGGWMTLSKVFIVQYHEVAAGSGSNSTRKYQVIIDVNSSGFYVVELLQWNPPPGGGELVDSTVISQSTAAVRFDKRDILRLRIQRDTNGSGGLGSGHGNGIIQLWVNGVLVINNSTVNIVNGSTTVGIGRLFCAGATSWTTGATTQYWDDVQFASDPAELNQHMFLASWRNSQRALQWDYPPTDAGSSSHWRSRRCPTDPVGDNPWKCELIVQGGGYVYNMHIVTGPVGLELVSHGFDTGAPPYYYYLRYANPQIGTYPITIRCFDQNGTAVDRSWTLEVFAHTDTTKFMYINSATGNNSNSGTRASPRLNINGWWQSDENDATHQLKQVFYDGGEYDIGGVSGITYSGSTLNPGNEKPKTHRGISGATWHGNTKWFQPEGGTGWHISGLVYDDPLVSGDTNMHIRQLGTCLQDGGVFEMEFVGSGTPSADMSNSACFMLADTFTTISRTHMVACILRGFRGIGAGLKNYNGSRVVCEGNTAIDCQNTEIFSHKGGDIQDCSIRGNKGVESISGGAFAKTEWINDPIARHDLDCCWNLGVLTGEGYTQLSDGADDWARNDNYRNNWLITFNTCDANSGTTTFEDELIQHNGAHTDGIRNTGTGAVSKVDLVTATSGLLNSTTGLKIGGPDGAHGCEVVLL